MPTKVYERELACLYETLNRREFVHPDPLEFLYHYDHPIDREIVGLVASGLAYGGVKQILKSVSSALQRMPSPRDFLLESSKESLLSAFEGFKHRFTTGAELATMLYGIKRVIERDGSLHACFLRGMDPEDDSVVPALSKFVGELSAVFDGRPRSLLPSPLAGSACKRLNLYLRWMVRNDDVDPGGWDGVPTSKLLAPVDTHMHNLSLRLGLTRRKQANLRTAFEITEAFKAIAPDDPVKYDFCLTRLGIRDDTDAEAFIQACRDACGGTG